MRLLPRIFASLVFGVPGMAAAQHQVDALGLTITPTVALLSDYLDRGISQTRNNPALQGTLDIEHSSGIYVAAFASNVRNADARIELDGTLGYRFSLGGLKMDVSGNWYEYPDGNSDLSYGEFIARASYETGPLTWQGALAFAPDIAPRAGNAWYVEGGADLALPLDLKLSGRIGYQWVEHNNRFGFPDYANWSLAVSRSFFGVNFSLGYYDTDIGQRTCERGGGAGRNICGARVVLGSSLSF